MSPSVSADFVSVTFKKSPSIDKISRKTISKGINHLFIHLIEEIFMMSEQPET